MGHPGFRAGRKPTEVQLQTDGDGLRIDTVHLDGYAVLEVRGEIDLITAASFGAAIDAGLDRAGKVVLDFSGVTFMDSSGLNVLVAAVGHADGDSLRIRNAPVSVHRLLSITGLDEVIRIEGGPSDLRQSAS
ncbi:MAG: STAS domain-containing protein [Ilumatobacteraceae bacterium]